MRIEQLSHGAFMDSKKAGSAIGAIICVAAVMASFKHGPDLLPKPAPAPAPLSAAVEISAPAQAAVGELVVLSVEDSDASSFSWQVVPPTKHFMVIDDGRRAVFSAPNPGDYLFIVGAAKADSVDLKTHKLTVGAPVPSPTPAPLGDLSAKVSAIAISTKLGKPDAVVISSSFENVAAAVSAGAMTDPADIVQATKKAVQASLGPNVPAATPFLQGLQAELKSQADAGKLPDAAAHAQAWREIAAALHVYAVGP